MAYDKVSSLPAYHENQTGKDYCKQMIFIAIRKLGLCTDRQLSEHLGWAINRVTPRRGELVEEGTVIQFKKDKDPITNRMVSWWKEKPENYQPTLFD